MPVLVFQNEHCPHVPHRVSTLCVCVLSAPDAEGIADLSVEAQIGIYRAAARLATVDMEVAQTERDFLSHLQKALGLSDEKSREIEKEMPLFKEN